MGMEKLFFNIYKAIPEIISKGNFVYPDYSSSKVILIHGSSVGEIQSLENLIKKIREEFSDYKIVLTSSTATSQEMAHKKYAELVDFITFLPFDFYSTMDKFLNKLNPKIILVAETELWPNFFYLAKQKNIPLYIINGRISDKSYPNYLKIKSFIKMVLNCAHGILCQSELDKQRYIDLGASEQTTEVMKNLKFEIEKKVCDIDLKSKGFKTIVASSTHTNEEEAVINVYKRLKQKIKDLKLIIAPRHLTRLEDVKNIVKNSKFKYGLRTNNDDFTSCDIIILDTLGELSKVYDIVDVAFIGGSFNNKTGGHNPLEATIYSKPAISGTSIKNFRDIYSILTRENSAFIAKNEDELYGYFEKLLTDEEFYRTISRNCENCFASQQGGKEYVIKKLKEIL